MSIKRSKKPITAIHQAATSPTKTVTLVKAPQQPVLVATPVLSAQANGHSVPGAVHQHATSTAKMAKGAQRPAPVTAPVLTPITARRDARGRFLAKKSK